MQKQAPLWNVLQNISPALCKAYARKKKEKKKKQSLKECLRGHADYTVCGPFGKTARHM